MRRLLALVALAGLAGLAGCAAEAPRASPVRDPTPLLETYWRAVEIDGQPVPGPGGAREPHLVLTSSGNRMHGSTGCNRVAGGFELVKDALRFTGLATTRMACPPPVDDLERRFSGALNATVRQRVVGESLELLDAGGTVRMRLHAGAPPR